MISDWATVRVDDLAFGVLDNGEIPIETADRSNGLVAAMSDGAVISTGIHTGNVRVRAAVASSAPASVDSDDEWEEIVEVSVHTSHGQLRVDAFEEGAVRALPLLSTAGPGWYRLRVHACGRDTAPDRVQLDPVEDYLLAIWPAPPQPTSILRTSSRISRSLQAALPSRATQARPPGARPGRCRIGRGPPVCRDSAAEEAKSWRRSETAGPAQRSRSGSCCPDRPSRSTPAGP